MGKEREGGRAKYFLFGWRSKELNREILCFLSLTKDILNCGKDAKVLKVFYDLNKL